MSIISSHIVDWNPFLSTNKPTFLARKGETFLGTNRADIGEAWLGMRA
jgi:hypothetical protein